MEVSPLRKETGDNESGSWKVEILEGRKLPRKEVEDRAGETLDQEHNQDEAQVPSGDSSVAE